MPLVASLALPVAAVRARGLDRGACDLLADRRAAAPARRELAGRLLLVSFLLHCYAYVCQSPAVGQALGP